MLRADSASIPGGVQHSYSKPIAPSAPTSSRPQSSRRIKKVVEPESLRLLKDARDGKLDQMMRIQMSSYNKAVESTVSDVSRRKDDHRLLEEELRGVELELIKVSAEREILCANLNARETRKKELLEQLATATKAVSQFEQAASQQKENTMNKFEKRITKILVPPKASMESFRRKKPIKYEGSTSNLNTARDGFDAIIPYGDNNMQSTVRSSNNGASSSSFLKSAAFGALNKMSSFIAQQHPKKSLHKSVSATSQNTDSGVGIHGHNHNQGTVIAASAGGLMMKPETSSGSGGGGGAPPVGGSPSHKASVTTTLAAAIKFPPTSGKQIIWPQTHDGSNRINKINSNNTTTAAVSSTFIPFVSTMEDHIKSLARKVPITMPTIDTATGANSSSSTGVPRSGRAGAAPTTSSNNNNNNAGDSHVQDNNNKKSGGCGVTITSTVDILVRT